MMLRFDEESHADPRLIRNLAALYGVEHVPSDTTMREILDQVDPVALRLAFEAMQAELPPFVVTTNREGALTEDLLD